jgi:hypothetical protein
MLVSSGKLADSLGRSRYDLWAGVNVQTDGYNTVIDWDAIVPLNAPDIVSYGFFRPDWTFDNLPAGSTPGDFHTVDDRFWTGQSTDPSHPDLSGSWRPPAAVVADRSTALKLPFATTFNTGHGLKWYEDGRATSDAPWNNLGLQDELPPRRWVVRSAGSTKPTVSFDFSDAWHGGTSLLVNGPLDAPATVDLFPARLPLSRQTVVEISHKTQGPLTVELAVATAEAPAGGQPPYTYLPVGTVHGGGNGWTTARLRVGALLAGRTHSSTLHAVGVRLTPVRGATSITWRLGRVAVHNGTRRPAPPRSLRITDTAAAGAGTAFRFAWNRASEGTRHYELHRLLPDGSRLFLGGTPSAALYVPQVVPEPEERRTRFALTAVGEDFTVSAPVYADHTW